MFRIYRKYLKYKILYLLSDKLNHVIIAGRKYQTKLDELKSSGALDKDSQKNFYYSQWLEYYNKEKTIREIIKLIEDF